MKFLDNTSDLNFSIINKGFLTSKEYQVSVTSNNKVLGTFDGTALAPGVIQNFSLPVKIENIVMSYELKITSATTESNSDNNTLSYLVKVQPDFAVSKVERVDSTTIKAYIIEKKKMASAPVNVDFYIQQANDMKKIDSVEFDQDKMDFVTIDFLALANITGVFNIIAEVNHERKATEDNYMNNKGTFVFNPLSDFTIKSLFVTDENVKINLENLGNDATGNIDLILTDNPEIVSDPGQITNLLYRQEVNFGNNKELSLIINKSDMNPITGQNLYAVINPYKTVKESNMNNNFYKVLIVNGKSVKDDKYAALAIDSAKLSKDGKLDLTISNTGNAPAITPKVQLLDENEYQVTQKILSAIKANGKENVEFTDLDLDKYIVRVIYIGENKKEITVEQIVEKTAEQEPVFIEAEDMQLRNYYIAQYNEALNKKLILTFFYGDAQTKFDGEEGMYNIKVTYFDVLLGRAKYKLYIDGKLIDEWRADRWLHSIYPGKRIKVERVIKGVKLKEGSVIKIRGIRDFLDPAYLDCIELIPIGDNKDKDKHKHKDKDKNKYKKHEKEKVKEDKKNKVKGGGK